LRHAIRGYNRSVLSRLASLAAGTLLIAALPITALAVEDEPFRPGLRLGGRLHGGLLLDDAYPHHGFWIKRARLAVDLEPASWVRAELDYDLAELELKDAAVRLRVARWLRLKVGRFKKPFSRIELIGPGRLPVWRRGVVNSVIVEDFGFGDRDVGLAVRGRVQDFRYAVGVFNGNPTTLRDNDTGKDISARFTYRPHEVLRLGVSGGFKYVNQGCTAPELNRRDSWGAGVDARFRLDPVDWVVEGLWGMKEGGPRAAGFASITTFRIPLGDGIEIHPVFKAELLAYGLRAEDNLAWSLLVGANVHIGDYVRVMVQGEAVWAQANVGVVEEERLLVVQLAFDYRRWLREGT